jgi:uncharacterized protein YutE (UPF0331/DUF86 family)
MDDVINNKAAIIERCLARINEEYFGHEQDFLTNYTKQDAIILNLQRACEAAIDLGTRIIRLKKLGVPQSASDVYAKLEHAKILPEKLSKNLQAMVGFRNIAIHEYEKINLEIVKNIIEHLLEDFLKFTKIALQI